MRYENNAIAEAAPGDQEILAHCVWKNGMNSSKTAPIYNTPMTSNIRLVRVVQLISAGPCCPVI